jgi:hypothetical protein
MNIILFVIYSYILRSFGDSNLVKFAESSDSRSGLFDEQAPAGDELGGRATLFDEFLCRSENNS